MRLRLTVLLAGIAAMVLAAGGLAVAANITCVANPCVGTPRNDVIEGTAGGDDIRARSGNDIVRPIAGPDGAFGGRGNDNISDSSPQNTLEGEAGSDLIQSGGASVLDGGDGNDQLRGGGFSIFRGGAGTDRINAAEGSGNPDQIQCGSGRDTVTFDRGVDTVNSNCEIRRPQ